MASIPFVRISPTTTTFNLKPPSLPSLRIIKPTYTPPHPRKLTITCMSYNPTPATDRLISTIAYTLPFFNSLQYGRFLFHQYPPLASLFNPLLPLLSLYRSIPYSSFVAFFALYLGVVRNPSFSHFVWFNSMQAVTLDVLLVLPVLLERVFSPARAGFWFKKSAETDRNKVNRRWRYWLDQWVDTQITKSRELEDLDSVLTSNPRQIDDCGRRQLKLRNVKGQNNFEGLDSPIFVPKRSIHHRSNAHWEIIILCQALLFQLTWLQLNQQRQKQDQ